MSRISLPQTIKSIKRERSNKNPTSILVCVEVETTKRQAEMYVISTFNRLGFENQIDEYMLYAAQIGDIIRIAYRGNVAVCFWKLDM